MVSPPLLVLLGCLSIDGQWRPLGDIAQERDQAEIYERLASRSSVKYASDRMISYLPAQNGQLIDL
jgi:hypothetical protein